MSTDPYRYFRIEAHELVEQLEKGVLDLERGTAAADVLPRLLRLAHTLKGAARVVRQPAIGELAHSVEDVLASFRDPGSGSHADLDQALALLDAARAALQELGASTPLAHADSTGVRSAVDASSADEAPHEGAKPRSPLPDPAPDDAWELAAADGDAVDALLFGLAEARAHVHAVNEVAGALEALARGASTGSDSGEARRGDGSAVDVEAAVAEARTRRAEVEALAGRLEGSARELTARTALLGAELDRARRATERLRLAPARSVLGSLERVARDTAKQLGNQIAFEVHGGDIRVDTRTLGGVRVALVQAVRNAVAHGIERPGEREARGKPPSGRVAVRVERRGDRVAFVCEDDGRGIDHDAVRRLARDTGRLAHGDAAASDADVIELLFAGGLSTSRTVTETAGRGVGLGLVRATIDKLRGEVRVRSQAGRGTTIECVVPLAIAGIPSLLVEADARRCAIALDAVVGAIRVSEADVVRSPRGEGVVHEGRLLAFAPLGMVLGRRAGAPTRAVGSAVVVRANGGRVVIGVDRLHGLADVMLRPLPPLTPACPLVIGAYLDADGEPRLLLDADALVEAVQRPSTPSAPPARGRSKPILVIDDSLTTRMLERSILESAGYEVELAVSAEEGIERARRRAFGLFLVDVEMPGMDGFSFVEYTRRDPALANVPAVLVTSLDTEADRQRGTSAGAAAYIVKGDFDQGRFLTLVRTLLE